MWIPVGEDRGRFEGRFCKLWILFGRRKRAALLLLLLVLLLLPLLLPLLLYDLGGDQAKMMQLVAFDGSYLC